MCLPLLKAKTGTWDIGKDITVKISHQFGYATLFVNNHKIDRTFFFFKKEYSLMLGEYYVFIRYKLTLTGYKYVVEYVPREIEQIGSLGTAKIMRGKLMIVYLDSANAMEKNG
jgi:hypothetical protein